MRLIFLISILLLVSCQQAVYDVPETVYDEPVLEIVEEAEPEPVVEEPIIEPLEVKVTATETRDELVLNSTFTCAATGGEEPYFYRWKVNGKIADCDGVKCNLQFEEIGEFVVGCEVNEDKYEAAMVEVIPEQRNIKQIYVLGDSLSAGTGTDNPKEENWAYLLSQSYDAELFNYVIPGATTGSVGDSQMKGFKEANLTNELVFLWVGANDIVYFHELGSFARAYEDIVVNLTRESEDVILVTIPDVSALQVATTIEEGVEDLAAQFGFEVKVPVKAIGKEILATYNDVIWAVGKKYDLPVVDMFEHMEGLDQSLISADHFHPNTEGHVQLHSRLKEDVEGFYPRAELS